MFTRRALQFIRHNRHSFIAAPEPSLKTYLNPSPSSFVTRLHTTTTIQSKPFDQPHDLGGNTSTYASLNLSNPDALQDWEINCHALFAVLAIQGAVTTDGLRRSIESLTSSQYNDWGYYEKWSAGMTTLLLENQLITVGELNEALFGKLLVHPNNNEREPCFSVGELVRVRSYRNDFAIEWKRPHIRVPGYIYGVIGVIERVCDEHQDPSFLAFGLEAPKVRLYRVRFQMKDVWPEHYDNSMDDDVIEVEIYEPWLERSSEKSGRDFGGVLFDHTHDGSDCSHNHSHEHDHNDHSHDPRPLVEERAVSLEGVPRPGKELFSALMKVLTDKCNITHGQVREMSERLAMAGKTLNGASLIAKAWVDASFEERLLLYAPAAAAELDIITSNPNAPTVLTIVKNTDTIHNLVVCTLCSCYPSGLLGIAPSWYKSREYRARAVREPREVLLEFGTKISDGCQIRVHDSTADHRYLVLPMRPKGTEGWSEGKLRALVTRDCMVGVSVPRVP